MRVISIVNYLIVNQNAFNRKLSNRKLSNRKSKVTSIVNRKLSTFLCVKD